LPHSCANCLEILGSSTSWSPKACQGVALPLPIIRHTKANVMVYGLLLTVLNLLKLVEVYLLMMVKKTRTCS